MYEEILQTQPDHPAALYLLGMARFQQEELEAAAQLIRKSLELDGAKEGGWFVYGNILLALKRYAEAIDAFEEALSRNPKSVDSWVNRGVAFLEIEQPTEAIESIARALALDPGKLEARINGANAKYQLGRFD